MANALRDKVAAGELATLMAAHNPLSARLAEEAGFDGIWASGFELSAALTLLQADRPIGVETLGTGASAVPAPPSVEPMQATLYLKPTPQPPAPEVVVRDYSR